MRLSQTRRRIDGFPANSKVSYVTWKGNQFSGRMGDSVNVFGTAKGGIVKGALSTARPCHSRSRARSGQECSMAGKCNSFKDTFSDFGKFK